MKTIIIQGGMISPQNGKRTWHNDDIKYLPSFYSNINQSDVVILDIFDEFSMSIIEDLKCDKIYKKAYSCCKRI